MWEAVGRERVKNLEPSPLGATELPSVIFAMVTNIVRKSGTQGYVHSKARDFTVVLSLVSLGVAMECS